jgi:hypothetical protein
VALVDKKLHHLDERIAQYDRHIHAMAGQCTVAQRLMQLPPIPPPFLPAGRERVALCRQACRPTNPRPQALREAVCCTVAVKVEPLRGGLAANLDSAAAARMSTRRDSAALNPTSSPPTA